MTTLLYWICEAYLYYLLEIIFFYYFQIHDGMTSGKQLNNFTELNTKHEWETRCKVIGSTLKQNKSVLNAMF